MDDVPGPAAAGPLAGHTAGHTAGPIAGALTAARRRREAETRLMREGLDVWRCRQQQLLAKKVQEQRQLREMLLTYSPWGKPGGGAPNSDTIRKRKALQLETLYGGPPLPASTAAWTAESASRANSNTLPRLPAQQRHDPQAPRRLRCDPQLLFQFQEADRRAVDNLLRYRTDPHQQQQYRLELDRMVQEKRFRQQQQQQKQMQQQQQRQQNQPRPTQQIDVHQPRHNEQQQQQEEHQQQQQQQHGPPSGDQQEHPGPVRRRRSAAAAGTSAGAPQWDAAPQQHDSNWGGVELVPLLDRRRYPSDDPTSPLPRPRERAHLPTTDVTNVTKVKEEFSQEKEQTWRDLAAQIDRKKRQMEASRAEELERCRQHFETWQLLWGRPGHGAPRDVKVKEKLDVILYHLDQGARAASRAAQPVAPALAAR